MSFTSLLFCPDENTARLVTQVLSELDFTVDTVHESFAAVQRLTAEHFDALVVDCQNEQDASLLFKAARNSAQNSSSLSVAVVEGQAGVARAFRIGANLVLTKPINVEQSKSTLRVARGLLKKAQPKAPTSRSNEPPVLAKATPPAPSKPDFNSPPPAGPMGRSLFATPPKTAAPPSPVTQPFTRSASPTPTASVPFSGLLLESDPEPATEAADAAVLESLPEISVKRSGESAAPVLLGQTEPIATNTSGQAAAAALAPDPNAAELRTAGASPMVTNEPIVATNVTVPEPAHSVEAEPVAPPSFSALESSRPSSGGSRFLKVAVVLALIGAGGYFAWQQPQARQYVQKLAESVRPSHAAPAAGPQNSDTTAAAPPSVQPSTETGRTHELQNSTSAPISTTTPSTMTFNDETPAEEPVPATSGKNVAAENVEVQELPFARDSGKTSPTPKVQPIIVKGGESPSTAPQQPSAPPPVNVVSGTDATLPAVMPTDFELPKPAPGTIRISQGVSQGLLIKKVQPLYPPIAKQMHRYGSVQLLATIGKSGDTTKVQVLNGDPMLARSAVDAVKQWKYRPYLLNGQPVEIETQITVTFTGQ